jgi:DnaK suppressor protein
MRSKGTARAERSALEVEQIRGLLQSRYDELCVEYDLAVADSTRMRYEQSLDRAGDDDADSGTKASERERELSVIASISDRRTQVEYALRRLQDGSYGWCEGCGVAIPVERLAVFPSATSCVTCKQTNERRAA